MRLSPLTGTMRCKLRSSPFGSPSLLLSLPAHTKSQRRTGQGSASHGVHSGGSKWSTRRCLSWGRPCQQRWGLETWFSHPVPASGGEHQSITDSSPSHHSPSCPCHVASGDDSVPVWLWLLRWPHAQAARPGHLFSGALALGGQPAHCPLSPPWPGERSGTHRGSRAITPKPSGPSETWGGPATGLRVSLLPADWPGPLIFHWCQRPSTAARAPSLGPYVGLALLPWECLGGLSLLCRLPKGCLDSRFLSLACACQQLYHRGTLLPVCTPSHTPGTTTTAAPTGWTLHLPPTKSHRHQGHSPLSRSPGETPALRQRQPRTPRRIPARGDGQVRSPQGTAG